MKRKTKLGVGLAVLILTLGCVLKYVSSRTGDFLYGGDLKPSEFRYEVYTTGGGSIIPGSSFGGSGLVRVYDVKGRVIFERAIKSTFSDISLSEGELFIAGEGVWPLKAKP